MRSLIQRVRIRVRSIKILERISSFWMFLIWSSNLEAGRSELEQVPQLKAGSAAAWRSQIIMLVIAVRRIACLHVVLRRMRDRER